MTLLSSATAKRTALWRLSVEQRIQSFVAFESRFRETALRLAEEDNDDGISTLSISSRQLDRWFRGALRGIPRRSQCRVLERMFLMPVEDLFRFDDDAEASGQLALQVRASAERARRFLVTRDAFELLPEAVEQIMADARTCARAYPHVPVEHMLPLLKRAQETVFELLAHRFGQPEDRELYFCAASITGMLAKASHDCGDVDSAMTQSRAAVVCAEKSGHAALQAWVRGLQSLISFWANEHDDAIAFAQSGEHLARNTRGAVRAWLPALEARAQATIGNTEFAIAAIRRAEHARDMFEPDDLDSVGGIANFSIARQEYYSAEAIAMTENNYANAMTLARSAVQRYENVDGEGWDYSDDAGARCVLAYVHAKTGDVDAASEAMRRVLTLDPELRINGIMRSAQRLQNALDDAQFKGSAAAASLREEIHCVYPSRSILRMN